MGHGALGNLVERGTHKHNTPFVIVIDYSYSSSMVYDVYYINISYYYYELRISIVKPSGKQNEIFLVLENVSKKGGNDSIKL